MKRLHYRVLFVLATAAIASGCGPSPARPIVPVEGTVVFKDGTNLPKGTRVVLNPSAGDSKTATGVTAEDGTFKLTHASGRTGAEEGVYTVQLLAPEGDDGAFFKLVPAAYNDGSILTADIKPGMTPLKFIVEKVKGKNR